jgi:hypothetical protein
VDEDALARGEPAFEVAIEVGQDFGDLAARAQGEIRAGEPSLFVRGEVVR